MLDDDDYSDTAPVREVKPGPYWRPPAVREAHRVQLVRAEEQTSGKGSGLAKVEAVVMKKRDGRTDVERRRLTDATKHLSVLDAALQLGVDRDTVYEWRRKYA